MENKKVYTAVIRLSDVNRNMIVWYCGHQHKSFDYAMACIQEHRQKRKSIGIEDTMLDEARIESFVPREYVLSDDEHWDVGGL